MSQITYTAYTTGQMLFVSQLEMNVPLEMRAYNTNESVFVET